MKKKKHPFKAFSIASNDVDLKRNREETIGSVVYAVITSKRSLDKPETFGVWLQKIARAQTGAR